MKRILIGMVFMCIAMFVGCGKSNSANRVRYYDYDYYTPPKQTTSVHTTAYVYTTIPKISTTISNSNTQINSTTESTSTVETTIVTTETTVKTTTYKSSELPENIMDSIYGQMNRYPGMRVAMGIYSLDGKESYEYNADTILSSGCTVKAPYAMFVLKKCEELDIDIDSHTLIYESGMRNDGSGVIKEDPYGSSYTISELLRVLLGVSDNTAYNILLSEFYLEDYQKYLKTIEGQNLNSCRYGSTNVRARRNEWFEIYKYVNSDSKYSETLKNYLTGTNYCYLAQGMENEHDYMHKSGWADGSSYTCACDCAIFDDKYLVVVLTEDYSTGEGHTNSVCSIGWAIEQEFLL